MKKKWFLNFLFNKNEKKKSCCVKNVEIINLILNFAGAGAGPFLPNPAKITGSGSRTLILILFLLKPHAFPHSVSLRHFSSAPSAHLVLSLLKPLNFNRT